MIEPYVGRIVSYYPGPYDEFPVGYDGFPVGIGPLAAIVTHVHAEILVDVTVFSPGMDGRPSPRVDVPFRQPEDGPVPKPYCQALIEPPRKKPSRSSVKPEETAEP